MKLNVLVVPGDGIGPEVTGQATQVLLACGGLVVATAVRVALGGPEVAASVPAAGVFACLVFVTAVAAGWRPALPARSGIATGTGGAGFIEVPTSA